MDALTAPSVPTGSHASEAMREELCMAVDHLRNRGLAHSAKWVAELLAGLPEEEDADPPQEEAPVDARLLQVEEGDEHDRCKKERRKLLLARSYVDLREFRRAAHALEGCKGSHALFVRKYSLYMAGEKRKEEERQELKGQCPVVNVELKSLEKELAAAYNTQSLDSFGMFLYGLVLTERAVPDSARAVLVAACNAYPWNWAAWSALTQVCLEPEHLHRLAVTLKPHYMRDIFVAQALSELSAHEQSLQLYTALQETFPRSRYIKAQSATANYSKREFDVAEEQLEEVRAADPYGLEGLDILSNILYVRESQSQLSYLAHHAHSVNKFSPETCVIVGNYYSLLRKHEKAVIYFQRALKLNRRYLYAWTLMGHEFLELRKPETAINAYRTAVEINPRDYRGWYMLGHTYEVMHMIQYAIYYYEKAASVCPYDARVWVALGVCFECLSKNESAAKYYKRAVQCVDRDGLGVKKLAELYENTGNDVQAAYYYKKRLDRLDEIHGKDMNDPDQTACLSKLGDHCFNNGDYQSAADYFERLFNSTGASKDYAKRKLKEIFVIRSQQ